MSRYVVRPLVCGNFDGSSLMVRIRCVSSLVRSTHPKIVCVWDETSDWHPLLELKGGHAPAGVGDRIPRVRNFSVQEDFNP